MAVHVARLNSAVTLILLTGLCFLIASLFTLNEARSPQTELSTELTDKLTVEQLLDTAESEYWFALADHGDTATIANGILYAKKALEKLPQECESPVPDKHCIRNSKRGEQLIADMSHQLAIYQDTLFGLFPVLSLVRGSILLSPDATGNYEAIDDPNATAILQAGSKLAELLNRLLPGYPSLHIVVTGFDWQGNRREDLEAEVLSLLQRSPRFYLHPGAEVEDIIHDEIGEQAALLYSRTGIINQSILSTLTDAWHVDNIIGIQFTELYSTENKAFYKVTANVDGSGALASANGASALGLIHHANDKWIWSGLGHLLLLLSAVLVAWQLDSTLKGALLAIAGFLFGRLIPYAVLRYTIPLQPPTDALMLLSWWWVLLFTFSIVVLPIIGLRFATAKIPLIRRTLAKPNGEGRLGVMAFSVCAGTMAWCVWPVVAYFGEHHAIWRIALVLPASLLLSYLLGRTLDDTDLDYPLGQSNLLVVTSMIAPIGLLIAQAPFVYWLITMTVLFTALWFSLRRKERRRQGALQQDDEEGPFSIKSKAATVRPQELNVLWKRINENTTDSNIKWCHFHGSEPEICQAFALSIAKRALPQPAGSPRFPEVDLGKAVMHSGWEPFKELLNIDSDVRREAEGKSVFDED